MKDEKPAYKTSIKIKYIKYILWVVIIGLAWAIGSKGRIPENAKQTNQSHTTLKKKPKRKKRKKEAYQAQVIDTSSLIKLENKYSDTSENFSDLKPQDTL